MTILDAALDQAHAAAEVIVRLSGRTPGDLRIKGRPLA
jgi:hypothetical protein